MEQATSATATGPESVVDIVARVIESAIGELPTWSDEKATESHAKMLDVYAMWDKVLSAVAVETETVSSIDEHLWAVAGSGALT